MVKRITKELTRSRKSNKDRQCNGQKDYKELTRSRESKKDRQYNGQKDNKGVNQKP